MTEDELLIDLHNWIDEISKRKNRGVKVDPIILKSKLTLYAFSGRYLKENPETIQLLTKNLVKRGSVETNLGKEGVYPLDAYFVPKTEL